jgi:hypothetical protein
MVQKVVEENIKMVKNGINRKIILITELYNFISYRKKIMVVKIVNILLYVKVVVLEHR